MRRTLGVSIMAVTVTTLLLGASGSLASAQSTDASPAGALHRLFASEWQREMREDPLEASADGFHEYDGRWPDLSPAALAREHAEDQQALQDLAAIDRSRLATEDRISYDLFRYRTELRMQGYDLKTYLMPIDQLGGIQTLASLTRSLRFANAADYEHYVERLQAFAPFVEQTIALLRQGVADGMTRPRVVMERIPHQIAANVVAKPEDSPFYAPFKQMPEIIAGARQAQLRESALAAIASVVTPAYRRLQEYFDREYLPRCRTTIAAEALPNGKAYYAYQVRKYTTTNLTPEQIHQIGLRRVAEIHAAMERVIKETGFEGGYPEFLHFLRSDPRFYYTDPGDLLEAYRAQAKQVDPLLVQYFPVRLLPRVTYGVRPIPAALAPDTYPAYSVPPAGDGSVAGFIDVNLYKPESRPKYDIPVLTCHEGRPGHQLQMAIAMELSGLPEFRRFDYYSSYGEGWGLYTETLCKEMGLYPDPYSEFGYLDWQMWRAVRLVVDTGIHAQGWSRERAVSYFEENTALSLQNINTEVDRYIAWPGQSLSYMIGEIEIEKLRRQAERELGPNFSLKEFHAAVLEHGSLPLTVLAGVLERWIADARQAVPETRP